MSDIHTIQGHLNAENMRVALVAARFNDFIVERLLSGAIDCLERHGALRENLTIIRVPGAFEIPLVLQRLAKLQRYDALLALGCVIRGATPHFDYVCAETAKGIAQTMLSASIPIGFGVLTCDTIEQAIERAGSKGGNKGVEAALAMLETYRVLELLA